MKWKDMLKQLLIGLGCARTRVLLVFAVLPISLVIGQETEQRTQQLPTSINIANKTEIQEYNSFDCGLVTRYSANRIPKNCLQEAINILLDEDLAVTRRTGSAKYNTSPCLDAQSVRGLWPFRATDGSNYIVILSSQTMYQTAGSGDCTAISGLTGQFSATAEMDCVQSLGKIWCTNGSQDMFNWDGSTFNWVATAPRGNLIGAFRNRILVADISGDLSRIRGSGELDGTDWAIQIPGKSTTPFSIAVGGLNDGKQITALMGQYQDSFFIAKEDSLWALYGNDRRDFVLRNLNNEVGVIDYKSVREKDNALFWMSKRGVEKLSGTMVNRISDSIRPTIDELLLTVGNRRALVQTTQSDWENGQLTIDNLSPMSATINQGNVQAGTSTRVDTSDSDFYSGTLINSTATAGNLTYSQGFNHHAFINAGAESGLGDCTNWDICEWDSSFGGGGCFNDTNRWTATGGDNQVQLDILNESNNILYSKINTISDGQSCESIPAIDLSTFPVRIKVRLLSIENGATIITNTSKIFVRGNSFTYSFLDGSAGPVIAAAFDVDESNIITSGTAVSQIFDMSFATPVAGPFQVAMASAAAYPITFRVRSATSTGGAWSAYTSQTNNAVFASLNRRYQQYEAAFGDVGSSTSPIGNIQSVTLNATTTGYYITDCFNTSPIASWDTFTANYIVDGGSITFYMSTGAATNCGSVTRSTNVWTLQENNSNISIVTSTFVGVRVFIGPASSTAPVSLNDITIRWNDSGAKNRVASAVYRNRYWMFYSTQTGATAANDHVVFNEKDVPTVYEGINARSATLYNRKLYTGDSQNTGFIRLQDTGHSDSGSAYDFRLRTIDDDLGNSEQRKVFNWLYLEFKSENDISDDINISVDYYLDGSTTSYSLGSVNLGEADEPGILSAKVPFPANQRHDGKWISLRFTYTGIDGPVTFYKAKLYYERLRED